MTTAARRMSMRVVRRARAAGTRASARARTIARREDALAVLADDHARIAELFERFDRIESDGPRKASIVERICDEIGTHSRIEEEIFYPSVRAAIDADELMDEAAVEHEAAKAMVEQLRELRPGDFHYDAKVRVLGQYVRHHVDEEERQIFPRARRIDLDLVALGRALKARKRQLKSVAPGRRPLAVALYPGAIGP